jgi:hypothetical protein
MRVANIFTVLLLLAAPVAADLLPVPDETDQAEGIKLVEDVFGGEIKKAQKPAEKLFLISQLMEEARGNSDDPISQYAILNTALKVAPDTTSAIKVIDTISQTFDVNAFQLKLSVVLRLSKTAKTKAEQVAVANSANALMDQATANDDYDSAITLGNIALKSAKKARKYALVNSQKDKNAETKRYKIEFEKVKKSISVLEGDPTNAEANLIVGSYRCFVTGDWENSLAMLALGSDETLRSIAQQELSNPTTSDEQIALGDDWHDLSEDLIGLKKDRLLQRARFWYEASLTSSPPLSRLKRARIEKKLAGFVNDDDRSTWAKGCVLAYSFSKESIFREGNNVMVKDLTGQKRHGLMMNGSFFHNGIANECLSLDGVDDYVITPSIGLQGTGSYSISMLVKCLGPGTQNKNYWTLCNMNQGGSGYQDPFHIYILKDKQTISARVGNGAQRASEENSGLDSTHTVRDRAWHHILITYDAQSSEYVLYINGKQNGLFKPDNNWTRATTSGPFTLGVWPAYQAYFRGYLDEIAVWNRALSSAAVKNLFKYSKSRKSYCEAISEASDTGRDE